MSKGAAATADHGALEPRCPRPRNCCLGSSGRPCFVDQWAEERIGPEPGQTWESVVEMDGGQWRARRKANGSLEYKHTRF